MQFAPPRLKPETDSGHEGRDVEVLAAPARQIGGSADLPFPHEAHVGCKLTHDLIAKPQPQLDLAQAGSDADLLDLLNGEIEL